MSTLFVVASVFGIAVGAVLLLTLLDFIHKDHDPWP
jgi:hypothetical protein